MPCNFREYLSDISRAGAFIVRDFHLTRRYFSWALAFTFYSFVSSVAVVMIGVASGDHRQTANLMLGALMWSYLEVLFHEIANSISYERWEGTIEYTFMAPVSRFTHLLGVSLFASIEALVRVSVIFLAMQLFVDVDLSGANLGGVVAVMLLSSISFMGLGILAAILPLLSPERGAQATEIIGGLLLLVSGVYYPVDVLPQWLQPFSWLSPATYTLQASRELIGIGAAAGSLSPGQPLSAVWWELSLLTAIGVLSIPIGLLAFGKAEEWAKKTGKLKRSG